MKVFLVIDNVVAVLLFAADSSFSNWLIIRLNRTSLLFPVFYKNATLRRENFSFFSSIFSKMVKTNIFCHHLRL